MQNEFILVRTDGTYSIVKINDNDFVSQARKLLDSNTVNKFYLFDDECLFYNSEAKPGVDKLNFYATRLNQVCHKGIKVFGDALIGKCYGENVVGLTSDAINRYVTRLSMNGYLNKLN